MTKMIVQQSVNNTLEIVFEFSTTNSNTMQRFADELAKHDSDDVFGVIMNDDKFIGTMHKDTRNELVKIIGMFANGEVQHYYA